MLSTFPLCVEGWLDICDMKMEDMQSDDWKSCGIPSLVTWNSKFCMLKENDSELYIFNDEHNIQQLTSGTNLTHYRLDNELSAFRIDYNFSYCDDVISNDLMNKYNKRNPSLSQTNTNKSNSRGGLFRNGSRFFGRGKSSTKFGVGYQSNKDTQADNNQPTKSVSSIKRTRSLSRISRKKSEERSDYKVQPTLIKNSLISQSTGDLTLTGTSASTLIYYLGKDTKVSEIHSSLVGGRPNCFSLSGFSEEIDVESSLDKKSMNAVFTTKIFSASSNLEKLCWMKRLQQTLKPNMINENRINNSLKLTLFESKCLPVQKRKYYCTVSLDKSLYAKTTIKLSGTDGCVFWAEDLVLNDLPSFKNLTISLYKEPESVKDFKRKKKKHQNQCIGQVIFSHSTLSSKTELQSWYYLKSSEFMSDRGSSNNVQLRIKHRFQSLKVLEDSAYSRLYEVATANYLEMIQILEKNLPIKLKEEIAICLVNIHEKSESIIPFLIDLISEEINGTDDSSMTLRANTIVTKVIESHMKLVGFQYLHDMLYPIIHRIMYKDDTIEVDPSRYETNDDQTSKLLNDNQHMLTVNLKDIWERIYNSKDCEFPKQLKLVYVGWRKKLGLNISTNADREKIENHCDVIVSGCLFLRLICPAILSPHLFGLVSFFSEKSTVQRTLTLMAKSLQSLANFSTFGEKEQFMAFLDQSFQDEIPRMHEFLRSISSFKSSMECDEESTAVNKEIHYYGSTIDLQVELARLFNCLVSESAKELIDNSTELRNNIRLSEILDEISEKLRGFVVTPSKSSISHRRIQLPIRRSIGQRRTLSTQFLNSNDLVIHEKNSSPPRMGSPISKLSDANIYHNNVDYTPGTLADNVINKSIKSSVGYSPIPPTKTYIISAPKIDILPSRRTNSNTKDCELNVCQPNSAFFSSTINDNQLQESISNSLTKHKIPPRIPPRKVTKKIEPKSPCGEVYDNVSINSSQQFYSEKIDLCDVDFYKENPLYDLAYNMKEMEIIVKSGSLHTDAINRYFTVRTQINALEDDIKRGINQFGTDQNKELSKYYQQLDQTKKEIHLSQVADLKQLHTMLNFNRAAAKEYPSANDSGIHESNVQTDSMTSYVLDDVITSMSLHGASLDQIQEKIRKHNKKHTFNIKPQSDHSLQTLPIDISEYENVDVTGSSQVRIISPSSKCSSLTTG